MCVLCSPIQHGRLSRWRTRILNRRRGQEGHVNQSDSPEQDERAEDTPPSVTGSLSPTILEATTEGAIGGEAEEGAERSDTATLLEGEATEGENPLPLWLSFSPSVEHFVKGVMEAASNEGQPSSSSELFEVLPCSSSQVEPVRSRRQGTKRVSASIGLKPRTAPQSVPEACQVERTSSGESASSVSQCDHMRKSKSGVSSSEKKTAKDQGSVVGLSHESLSVIKPLVEKINDNFTCKICMDRFVSVTFCPCGHYVTCRQCAEMLTQCPLCRAVITHSMQVYQ